MEYAGLEQWVKLLFTATDFQLLLELCRNVLKASQLILFSLWSGRYPERTLPEGKPCPALLDDAKKAPRPMSAICCLWKKCQTGQDLCFKWSLPFCAVTFGMHRSAYNSSPNRQPRNKQQYMLLTCIDCAKNTLLSFCSFEVALNSCVYVLTL